MKSVLGGFGRLLPSLSRSLILDRRLLLPRQLKSLHSDVTSMNKTSLTTVHLIQHLLREIKLLGLWLR
jgi:hypothetical protein